MTHCPKPESEDVMKKAVAELLKEHTARTRRRRHAALAGMTLSALVVLVTLLPSQQRPKPDAAQTLAEVARPEVAEGGGLVEGLDASTVAMIGVPLPSKPLPNWQKPPCTGRKQREINGACWMKLADPPGDDFCGETYEYQGACWAPVSAKVKSPLSVDQ